MALGHTITPKMGISKISIAPVALISGATAWEEIFYTLKDSLKINQAEPTKTEVKVDQVGAPIYTKFEPNEFTVTAQIPDTNAAVLTELFNTSIVPSYTPAGMTVTGISLDTFVLNTMVKIDYENNGGSVIITNGQMVAYVSQDTPSTNPLSINISIVALNSFLADQPDVIFYTPTTSAPTLYTWIKYGSNSSGAGMSDTQGVLTYIGMAYNKLTAVESTTPSDYIWTLLP